MLQVRLRTLMEYSRFLLLDFPFRLQHSSPPVVGSSSRPLSPPVTSVSQRPDSSWHLYL
ncbi:hypothetical protein F2Q69_00038084 [Brassica cretica]|uniref:Uncharacterized protein n=1 Tax=Brassica cretica TaxID=69181 RepID=A0A8S9SGW4_BRACR|nr:hypothetical protein F2Q69_00038084 [Brassica cretica]